MHLYATVSKILEVRIVTTILGVSRTLTTLKLSEESREHTKQRKSIYFTLAHRKMTL